MRYFLLTTVLLALSPAGRCEVIDGTMHHLRHGDEREWDDFPERAESDQLLIKFAGKVNADEATLSVRHRDLRHIWKVTLNGAEIGRLKQGDDEAVSFIPLPARSVRDGENELRVSCTRTTREADDVMVGEFAIIDRPRKEVVGEAWTDVSVTDSESGKAIPCRLTIADARGALVPLGTEPAAHLAIRAGVVYTATGRATLRLPAGRYTLYAGRGFEWGNAAVKLELKAGENPPQRLAIRREVDTAGYVAADTHVHTFTYSRHGDATIVERMVTLAGEGIELPIATDHNLPIDYREPAQAAGVLRYFTPVVGCEVTTPKLGHFNVFPVDKAAPLIDFRSPTWEKLFADVEARAPGAVVILNHARDIHGGFRPFDPSRHLSVTGEDLDGQTPRANAMEILNSGATINDPLLLFRDWMGCVNRGWRLTPIGSSDSHDVAWFIVGQGRTYVRVEDRDAGGIDVKAALEAFKGGQVLVSFGLLVEMKVNGRTQSGQLSKAEGDVEVDVTVSGPAWTQARRVELYCNGTRIKEAIVDPVEGKRAGTKAVLKWKVPKPAQDIWLTAIALGPGDTSPYWSIAKPYQRISSHWEPYVFGCSGAVYVDGDGSGDFQSALDYAKQIIQQTKGSLSGSLAGAAGYDQAVAAQVASLLRSRQRLTTPESMVAAVKEETGAVRDGFIAYARNWRESNAARAKVSPEPR